MVVELILLLTLALAALSQEPVAPRTVTFPVLNSETQADLYGQGTHAVLLAHGGRFDKESWKPQARQLANAGFFVLALRFRGDRLNPDGSPGSVGPDSDNAADVLAAVSYLRQNGAATVYAVGASFGGDAVGQANANSKPGTIARIVLLGSSGGDSPQKLTGRKLFIFARDDASSFGPRLPEISKHYSLSPQPKKLVILDGSAHAQFLFGTPQGPNLFNQILQFLSAP